MHNIGIWTVRTMYGVGRTAQVVKEMRRYNLDMLGISKCRWWLRKKDMLIYTNQNDMVVLTSENTAAASFWDSPYHLSVKDET